MLKEKALLLVVGLTIMNTCETSLVRKHESSASGETIAGIDVEALMSQLPSSLVRRTKESMEVEANGNTGPSADALDKALLISMVQVRELQSIVHDRNARIHGLEIELEDAKKACKETEHVKLPHGLLGARNDDSKTESIDVENHELASDDGDFDIMETDIYRNRKAQAAQAEAEGEASNCGCLEYTLAGLQSDSNPTLVSGLNGVWVRNDTCDNGKPVFSKFSHGKLRFLYFNSDENRWEFSTAKCKKQNLGWYPGVVGQECPISSGIGGSWTCNQAAAPTPLLAPTPPPPPTPAFTASECSCLEYTLAEFKLNRWYNGVWVKNGTCNNGKPVYSKDKHRFLNFDKDENRWEFSDTKCKTTRNWYPGVVGEECPISLESGGSWTCNQAHRCEINKGSGGPGNTEGCCTIDNPCPAGVGDCDDDEHCQGTLVCGTHDQGAAFGYQNAAVDVCSQATASHYVISAANVSDCPTGTYRIESSNACANAVFRLGSPYQFMGRAVFYAHPRGCSVDVDGKITHNVATLGSRSAFEKLICAKSNTCATHRCPDGQQHKVGSDNLASPTDSTCCEEQAIGSNCMVHTLCEKELGDLRNDKSFMCECVWNHERQRNKTLCEKWLKCLHNKQDVVKEWFKQLLEFVSKESSSTSSLSLMQSPKDAQDVGCFLPSQIDVFAIDCQCADTLQEKCGNWIDRQQCLTEYACASDEVCDTWKKERCANESARSLLEDRMESRAESTIGAGSRQTAVASVLVSRADDGEYLDEAVQRKCR